MSTSGIAGVLVRCALLAAALVSCAAPPTDATAQTEIRAALTQ